MKKHDFKSLPNFEQSDLKIDRDRGIIKGVQIVQQGDNKKDSYFNRKFLEDLVEQGNEQKLGVKCRFGHPSMCSESLGTFTGRYKDFRIEGEAVYADLHLCSTAKNVTVPNGGSSIYNYVLDMADKNPDMFGNSIVIMSELFEEIVDNTAKWSHRLISFLASDLVDDPAATSGLFDNSTDLGVIVTQFLDENPEIFDAINRKPEIIGDFFERYFAYSKRKSKSFDMSLLDKLKKRFSKKFDIDLTLADGSIIKVVTDAEEPQVGDPVNDAEGNPVADGEHLLPDGGAIVTADGKITEIKEPETEDPDGNADEGKVTAEQVMQSVKGLEKKFDAFMSTFAKTNKETEQAFEMLADNLAATERKVELMGKTITSKDFDAPKPGKGFSRTGVEKSTSGYDPEKVREHHEKNKQK